MKRLQGVLGFAGLLAAAIIALFIYLTNRPTFWRPQVPDTIRSYSHVFVIVMENHSLNAMSSKKAPYIRQLIARYGYDPMYFGVTHVSLPNYVALLSGSTHGTHSDNPDQSFSGPTLISQLNKRHITWQGVMQSLPYVGYRKNWYPQPSGKNPVSMPRNALYAKKHDPFMLFPAIALHYSQHVVPLKDLKHELKTGAVPSFVWITPNLCNDMHGQADGSTTCPANHPHQLVRRGNHFLATLIPAITHSPSWRGNAVIFITWDEAQTPSHLLNLSAWKAWLNPGPYAPQVLGIPLGGGSVPLIVISREVTKPHHVAIWADHYNLLKTIEAGFRLPYLGHAASPGVSLLSPFLP